MSIHFRKILKSIAFPIALVLLLIFPTDKVWSEEHYRLAGFGADFAPFNYADDEGQYMGIDHEIIDAIAQDQGFSVEKIDMPFNSALQAVEQGQVDGMMAAMSITPEREELYDFSDPYFESSTSFAAKAGSDYQDLEDLKGKKIAVKTGAMGSMIARDLQPDYNFEIIEYEDSSSMYQAVMGGQADAVVDETPVMQFAISTGRVALELVGDPQEPAPLGMAVRKGSSGELLEQFNQGLANIREDGRYDAIVEAHLGEDALEEAQGDGNFWQASWSYLPELMSGLKHTLLIAGLAILLGTVIGTLLALANLSSWRIFNFLAQSYIAIIRGVPMIVLAFFIYFGIPQALGIKIPEFWAGLLTVTLNASAYIAEIIRGGIQGINRGQAEAAASLGLPERQVMTKVVLPQAFKLMIPSLLNQFVISLKDTSILSVIGIVELTQAGKIIIARTYQSTAVWFLVGLIYFILITCLTYLTNQLDKRLT